MVAVDSTQHFFRIRSPWITVSPVRERLQGGIISCVIPGQVLDGAVAWEGGVRIQRLEPLAELVDIPEIAVAVAGRVGSTLVPLDKPLGIGEAAFFFADGSCGQEEDLRRHLAGIAAVGVGVPDAGAFSFEQVEDDQPLQLAHGIPLQARIWVLPMQGSGRKGTVP